MGRMKNNWTKDHSVGMVVGVILPVVFIPIVIFILSKFSHASFSYLFNSMKVSGDMMSKVISLSVIINLIVFYVFLNKEKYNFARGVIYATMLYLPVILYFNFIA
ncbi:MAG: hypothetical protein ACI9XP_001972 [Lentimonas sp.]|jgi:hypothetical protein